MRISDWSSDVCSSDLVARARGLPKRGGSRSLAALESARGSGEMGMRARSGLAAALAVGLVIGGMATPVGVAAQEPSDDRHAGYYYPEHGTPEVYDARASTLPDAARKARIAFVTRLTTEPNKAPDPPQALTEHQRRGQRWRR